MVVARIFTVIGFGLPVSVGLEFVEMQSLVDKISQRNNTCRYVSCEIDKRSLHLFHG